MRLQGDQSDFSQQRAVWSWGSNRSGKLGRFARQERRRPDDENSGQKVDEEGPLTVPEPISALDGFDIAEIACSDDHTVARSSDGDVFHWGKDFVRPGRFWEDARWCGFALVLVCFCLLPPSISLRCCFAPDNDYPRSPFPVSVKTQGTISSA
jgi:Regulator of chromosome condensation (RCC1) repeat